eukprot:COSAG06_NODE_66285_length_254_cov_1.961290_1_plen_45_part_10
MIQTTESMRVLPRQARDDQTKGTHSSKIRPPSVYAGSFVVPDLVQ